MAALPYVVKAFVGPSGGVLVDWLIKNKMSVRNTRRCIFTVGERKRFLIFFIIINFLLVRENCISFEACVFRSLRAWAPTSTDESNEVILVNLLSFGFSTVGLANRNVRC